MNIVSNAQSVLATTTVSERRTHYFLLFIYMMLVCRLWIMPIGSSLWLDETATYWTVMHGAVESLGRSTAMAGQFHLYMLIVSLSVKMFGLNEIALRLPSVIASCISSYLIFRLGTRFSGLETGIFAAILFVCIPEICTEASNARPYALMVLCSLYAISYLIKLQDSYNWRNAAGYVIATTLMVYMHHISVPFFILLAIYSTICIKNKSKAYFANIIVLVLLLPLIYMIVNTRYDNSTLSFASTPSFISLIRAIATDLAILVAVIYCASKIFLRKKVHDLLPFYSSKIDVFIIGWFVIPIMLFYSISTYTDYKVFIPRYMVLAYPALAFLLAATLQKISLRTSRYAAIAILSAFSIYIGGLEFSPMHHNEDWRGALYKAKQIAEPSKIPILFNSGYLSTQNPGWEHQTSETPDLSPLSAYKINTKIIPLPLFVSDKSRQYLDLNVSAEISSVNSFLVVLRGNQTIDSWLNTYAQSHNFKRHEVGNFHRILVVRYEKNVSK